MGMSGLGGGGEGAGVNRAVFIAAMVLGYSAIVVYVAAGMSKFGTPQNFLGIVSGAIACVFMVGVNVASVQPRFWGWLGVPRGSALVFWAPLLFNVMAGGMALVGFLVSVFLFVVMADAGAMAV